MNIFRSLFCGALVLSVTVVLAKEAQPKRAATPATASSPDDAAIAQVRKSSEQVTTAFNAGKVDELASMFLAKGEIIDEEGTVYQGEKEIKELLSAFFKKFPGTKLAMEIESVRIVGPVAIEEGTRTMKAMDGTTQSKFRYISVRAKTDDGWKIASLRDFSDDPEPTPNEYLQSVAWLIGDWINEGTDGVVKVSYKWSEDKNYVLGEFQLPGGTGPARKLSQRIGWDASARKIRSWMFESDGGFADGHWTVLEDGIVAKYSSVNADGTTATATITINQKDKDHFSMKGTDRIVGDDREPDFEINVVRRPPAAGK
ncbi:MAG: nuclear transport factor 2 family protein [Planctomycetales bacterium]|nr:nuclear transport factor 2 family protein [Planctomycetales bacterium]